MSWFKKDNLTIQTDEGDIEDVFTTLGGLADIAFGGNGKWKQVGKTLDGLTSDVKIDMRTKKESEKQEREPEYKVVKVNLKSRTK